MFTLEQGPRARLRMHDWVDERARALDAAVARKLADKPSLIGSALENLDRWERSRGAQVAYDEWREILREPVPRVIAFLLEDSERADRLRQSSPFTGILSDDERSSIFRQYESI